MLLQRRSSPSTILFNNTMQLSMYMRLTTNATILKALPRPFADNIYHFRRLSKKFPRLLSSTSKKQGGSEEIPKKMRNFVGSFGKRVRDATLLSIFQFFTFAARI